MAAHLNHYDNLKVARSASPDEIQAAHQVLVQKFRPFSNPGNPEGSRMMGIINEAFGILSNPQRRAEYDQTLAQQDGPELHASPVPSDAKTSYAVHRAEQLSASHARQHYQAEPVRTPRREQVQIQPPSTPAAPTSTPAPAIIDATQPSHLGRYWGWYALACIVGWMAIQDKSSAPRSPPPGPKPYQAVQVPTVPVAVPRGPTYVRSAVAPNGVAWPHYAGYLQGYDFLHNDGLSTVTVDNSSNDSDVFVKLVALDGATAYPVRQFYIPAAGRFTLKNVTAGTYDVRYRDLVSGGLSRSESMTLDEVQTNEGTQFSNMTMTLFKVRNGNMKTFGLLEAEF